MLRVNCNIDAEKLGEVFAQASHGEFALFLNGLVTKRPKWDAKKIARTMHPSSLNRAAALFRELADALAELL